MQFEGEHLGIGQFGHFFVLLAFTASLLASVAYITASFKKDVLEKLSWIKFARVSFLIQTAAVFIVFGYIFYMCANHYIEYLFAYKHTSRELEFKYLFASIWGRPERQFFIVDDLALYTRHLPH